MLGPADCVEPLYPAPAAAPALDGALGPDAPEVTCTDGAVTRTDGAVDEVWGTLTVGVATRGTVGVGTVGVVTDGVVTDGVVTGGVVTGGVWTSGVETVGAVSEGTVIDGTVSAMLGPGRQSSKAASTITSASAIMSAREAALRRPRPSCDRAPTRSRSRATTGRLPPVIVCGYLPNPH